MTIRRWPQTLLLTALALLIGEATIMLACNPAARPVADGEGVLPAAATEEPPTTPALASKDPTATPAAETGKPTATPSPEPTATPSPYPTLCVAMPEEYPDLTELGENPGRRAGFICFVATPLSPIPTPKYPVLDARPSRLAQAAQAGAVEIEIPLVYLRIVLSDNTEEVVAWLQRNGIPLSEDWVEGERGYIAGYEAERELGDDYIYAWVPASLLVAISQQEGITYMEDAGYLLDYGAGY